MTVDAWVGLAGGGELPAPSVTGLEEWADLLGDLPGTEDFSELLDDVAPQIVAANALEPSCSIPWAASRLVTTVEKLHALKLGLSFTLGERYTARSQGC